MSGPHEFYLRRCNEIAAEARAAGNTPFGALLAGPSGEILLEQGNVELTEHVCTGHAETRLMERASTSYPPEVLARCTLYTTFEPCVMCAGAIYWGNVRRVVYGLSERDLLRLTGAHEVNPTFDLPCREIFAHGQREITVVGPFPELAEEIVAVQAGYWD